MAKGLAVISGSNTVVFKALENGVVKMGGVHPDGSKLFAGVTISGSLALSGSEGINLNVSGSEFRIDNLSGISDQVIISGSSLAQAVDADGNALPKQRANATDQDGRSVNRNEDLQLRGGLVWAATSSIHPDMLEDSEAADYFSKIDSLDNSYELPEDFITITESGELRRVNKIDASAVVLNDGKNVEQKIGVLSLEVKLSQSTDIDVYNVDQKNVNLGRGTLNFKDIEHRTHVSIADVDPNDENGKGVEVTVDLDPQLRVETLSASMGLEVTGSSVVRGDVTIVKDESHSGDLSVQGSASVDGDLTVKGNLNIWGETSVTTAETAHLQIEDAIINIGKSLASGSENPATGGVDGANGIADLGFVFGDSNKRALILKSGDFYLGQTEGDGGDQTVTVDYETSEVKLYVPNLSASKDIQSYTLSVLQNADVGGTLDVTGATSLQDTLLVKGAATFDSTVAMTGSLTVEQSASIAGDLNVDGTGSFGQSVTLRSGANLTLDEGNATLTKGDLTLSDGDLSVNGVTTLSASLGGDQPALDVTGTTVLSSSAGSNALHVDSGDVQLDEALTVEGLVTLNSNAGSLNVTGSWTSDAALRVTGSLDIGGDVRLGTNSSNRVIVQGQFRTPIFQKTGGALADIPDIPSEYLDPGVQPDHAGYMFYLKGEGIPDSQFANGNKWYFNEGGIWHSSFFWDDAVDELGDDGL